MSLIVPRQTVDKTKYLDHCSNAELAAMFLNDEISFDEYFDTFKRKELKNHGQQLCKSK